jgi:spermidine dehydrogenase
MVARVSPCYLKAMSRGLSRRDFLNGVGLTIVAGLTPAQQIAAQPTRYPPGLTGLRGQHPGSFETMHTFAREGGRRFSFDGLPVEESYELVVVGSGISGLAAAWFYRRKNPYSRILILDNHDDFGGHAKRNEFRVDHDRGPSSCEISDGNGSSIFPRDNRIIIGYGGSESIQSPNTLYSKVAKDLLRELGVDLAKFETAFDRKFYSSLGLSRGVFFDRAAFGRDVLVSGDPSGEGGEPTERERGAKPLKDFIAAFPISEQSKQQLLALYEGKRDPLAGKSAAEKKKILKATSYRDYLTKICGVSEEVANCFQGRPLGYFGLGADAVAAADAQELGYPGFNSLKLARDKPEWNEPYIYHFPDGNATLARRLVGNLLGAGMMNIYDALDRDDARTRIRLDSTVLDVRHSGDKVLIGYARGGTPYRIAARHVVLACFHTVIPHIMPELPEEQREALSQNVKTPIVYTNVLVRNWKPWIALKVHNISAPMSFFSTVKLDFPVSLDCYEHPRDPDKPIVLHLVHVPGEPNQGHDARTQFRIGRQKLLEMTFADFETKIHDQLDRMLGPGGFSSARDIAAITVNRWAHGYSYVANSLFDPENYEEAVLAVARQKFGRVAIANTDSGGDAWAHFAIDHAERAVRELIG